MDRPAAAAAASTMSTPSSTTFSSPPPTTINSDGQYSQNRDNVAVSVNGGTNRRRRGSSYDFSNDAVMKAAADSKEFDFVTESPLSQQSPLAIIPESPGGVRVSFRETIEPAENRRSIAEQDEVLICSSNNSFRRKSGFMRTKTKSRLLDHTEEIHPRSHTQRMEKSQQLGKGASEIDEDDPFLEEDLPDDYRKLKYNALSVIQLLSLILIIAISICTLTVKWFRRNHLYGLKIWKWELMVLVLISGRLISGWVIRIAVLLVERNFLLRKRVLYFVYGLRNAVQNCLWLTLVLIAWECIFDKKVEASKVLSYVSKVWVCLLVGTIIWLVKTLLVKVLASSFHVSTFFDWIQDALFNQYVIEKLSGPPLVEIQLEEEEEERVMVEVQKLQSAGATIPDDLKANMFPKNGKIIGTPRKSAVFSRVLSKKQEKNDITIDHLHRLNQKNVSAWNMKRLTNIVRKGVLSTLDEKLQGNVDEDEAIVHITSENQAKSASKKIFLNVAKPGSKRIYLEDLMRFMGENQASKTLHLIEAGTVENGISKCDLKNWVVSAFRERRALALSLNDTKTAVNKLHHMLNGLVGVLIVVVWLLILKVATKNFLVFLSSQALLVAFVFGNTCKTTFEAIIFLFVTHPFDVGDRVEVDGVQMIVEEMNILTTIFLKFDNHKIYYPNSVLSTKSIHNYYRSPDMGDAIDFCIHISTPGEKIETMKNRITSYIDNKSDHWHLDPTIVMRDVEDLNKLKFSVWVSHKINFQDMGERWKRRSFLVEEMVKIFKELDIEYRLLPLDVNVCNVSSNRLSSNWTVCDVSSRAPV